MDLMVYISKHLENKPKSFFVVVGILLVLGIGLIDFLIPSEISLSIFYLIPVSLTTWFAGLRAGILISCVSAIVFLLSNEGERIAYFDLAIPIWNSAVIFVFFLVTTYLLSALNKSLDREKHMARTDHITGVANRKLFYEFSNLELKRAIRYGHPFTVAYIDLDNFKNINDSQGHKIGDILLQKVAKSIKDTIRETDIVARLGGDEFALLLPGIGYEPAQIAMVRVQNSLLETMQENQWPVTFSIGAITFMNPPHSVEDIIEQADYLMYRVKTSGKNRLDHRVKE